MPRVAVMTILQDEPVWGPLWLAHYRRFFAAEDIYILDHDSQPAFAAAGEAQVIPVHHAHSFDHRWLLLTVSYFNAFLQQSYDYVLFSEADELVFPHPEGQFRGDLRAYLEALTRPIVCCTGYEVVHQEFEPPLDWTQRPLLRQRGWWYRSLVYSKPLLSQFTPHWETGFHFSPEADARRPGDVDPELLLVHLHKLDFPFQLQRKQQKRQRPWSTDRKDHFDARQNAMTDPATLRTWWQSHIDTVHLRADPQPLERIPTAVQDMI